jgi:hypothetical protein
MKGLREFAMGGYLLLDATYTPLNHPHLSSGERDRLVLADLPLLVEELRKCRGSSTRLILVKANVCRLLDSKLTGAGFPVLNHGKSIPFPSTGQQKKFRDTVRQVLDLAPRHVLPPLGKET